MLINYWNIQKENFAKLVNPGIIQSAETFDL